MYLLRDFIRRFGLIGLSNLQVCAQFINQLIEHAVAKQAYAQAIRYRTDFTSIKDCKSYILLS